MTRPLRILTFTTLYPNSAQPEHGIFVEQRLRRLQECGATHVRVVAPVPWVPGWLNRSKRYAHFTHVPPAETRHGVEVVHPRYPVIPKVGMTVAPALLATWAGNAITSMMETGYDFDLLDAHYFYPDGVAAAMLSRRLNKPLFITARGSDINLIAQYRVPRALMRRAAWSATGLICVSDALRERMSAYDIGARQIAVLPNGVDLQCFKPRPYNDAREQLGLTHRTLLSVGKLDRNKGHHLAIETLVHLPDIELLVVGRGQEQTRLKQLSEQLGVAQRVRFVGQVQHSELPGYYSAADLLVLASEREGMPNVVLEALACGTRVVATNVGGIPEIIKNPVAGRLVDSRTGTALVRGIETALADRFSREATREYAQRYSWRTTVCRLREMFSDAVHGSA